MELHPQPLVKWEVILSATLSTDSDLIPTTTTIPTTTKGGSRCREPEADRIEFAAWIPDDLKVQARNKVARLDTAIAQLIIDEWAGSMATGRIERSPLGYLQALVSRLESGRFRLQYADEVEAMRKGEDRTASG